jgi:DNA recombination protein RmuC
MWAAASVAAAFAGAALGFLLSRAGRRDDTTPQLFAQLEATLDARFDGLHDGQDRFDRVLREELARSRQEAREESQRQRDDMADALHRLGLSVGGQVTQLGGLQGERLEAFAQQLARLTQSMEERSERLRLAVEARLAAIQADNAGKLDEMRRTVDEKLQATLEQRLGDSFRIVSERLEQVHRGLGEMQVLAAGVGDLKRVLTNVKTRGTWGEVQLGALLEQVLTREQFSANVATRPGSRERVEFALRLPGQEDGEPVWLPIDAKFPIEDYQKLLDAQDRADPVAADEAGRGLEMRLRNEAKSIREKYIEPPFTTDFAILYLPIEGLFAEALRRPGLSELLQRECRVTLAGPTTLAAMLNSLQMGFRTLAIEKRSSEVWAVLGAVKAEFGKFGEALAHTKKKLDEASSSISKAETRSRVLSRKLKEVEALPVEGVALPLPIPLDSEDEALDEL